MGNIENIKKQSGRIITIFCFFISVSVILPGCSILKPRVIEKIIVNHDTTTIHHRDSVFLKDSIYIKEWMKGDTVYIDRFRDRYIYKDRWRDSISIKEVHDTTTVERKIEKELTAGQKMKIDSFWWLLATVFGLAIWTFRKPILALIKTLI